MRHERDMKIFTVCCIGAVLTILFFGFVSIFGESDPYKLAVDKQISRGGWNRVYRGNDSSIIIYPDRLVQIIRGPEGQPVVLGE